MPQEQNLPAKDSISSIECDTTKGILQYRRAVNRRRNASKCRTAVSDFLKIPSTKITYTVHIYCTYVLKYYQLIISNHFPQFKGIVSREWGELQMITVEKSEVFSTSPIKFYCFSTKFLMFKFVFGLFLSKCDVLIRRFFNPAASVIGSFRT